MERWQTEESEGWRLRPADRDGEKSGAVKEQRIRKTLIKRYGLIYRKGRERRGRKMEGRSLVQV